MSQENLWAEDVTLVLHRQAGQLGDKVTGKATGLPGRATRSCGSATDAGVV